LKERTKTRKITGKTSSTENSKLKIQNNSNALRLTETAPNLKAVTTLGEIDFHEYLADSRGILLSHPADYTPVCTTEMVEQQS